MSQPLRVLVLCTGNSARSQMAEALLTRRGAGRVVTESAGSKPAARVNPLAVRVLAEIGIAWEGRTPKGMASVEGRPWDLVLTVCDYARDACPVFPSGTAAVHWGQPDPAEVTGTDEERLAAFWVARDLLASRIDQMLAQDLERLRGPALQGALSPIGHPGPSSPHSGG